MWWICRMKQLRVNYYPCRTRWVERLDALEVALDLALAVIKAFSEMVENINKQWNRDTVTQASALLKRFDFYWFSIFLDDFQYRLCFKSLTCFKRWLKQGLFEHLKSVTILVFENVNTLFQMCWRSISHSWIPRESDIGYKVFWICMKIFLKNKP